MDSRRSTSALFLRVIRGEATSREYVDALREEVAGARITDRGLVAERNRLRAALLTLMGRTERDRREPDKILCHIQSARRDAFDALEANDHDGAVWREALR